MSHVATIELDVKDLDALSDACKSLGLELIRDKKNIVGMATALVIILYLQDLLLRI